MAGNKKAAGFCRRDSAASVSIFFTDAHKKAFYAIL